MHSSRPHSHPTSHSTSTSTSTSTSPPQHNRLQLRARPSIEAFNLRTSTGRLVSILADDTELPAPSPAPPPLQIIQPRQPAHAFAPAFSPSPQSPAFPDFDCLVPYLPGAGVGVGAVAAPLLPSIPTDRRQPSFGPVVFGSPEAPPKTTLRMSVETQTQTQKGMGLGLGGFGIPPVSGYGIGEPTNAMSRFAAPPGGFPPEYAPISANSPTALAQTIPPPYTPHSPPNTVSRFTAPSPTTSLPPHPQFTAPPLAFRPAAIQQAPTPTALPQAMHQTAFSITQPQLHPQLQAIKQPSAPLKHPITRPLKYPTQPPLGGPSTTTSTQPPSTTISAPGPASHPPPRKLYTCRYHCGQSFTTSGHASRHAKTHLPSKDVACVVKGCNKRFRRADNMKQHAETHFRGKGRGRGRKALGDEVADEGGGYEDDEEEGENDEGVKGGQGRRRANRGMSAREASEMVRQLMEEQKKRVASTAQLERERVREREQREQREHIAAALDAGSCRENIGEVIPGSQLRRAESGSETVPTAGSGRTVVPPPSKRQSLIATSAAAAAASMNASRAKPQSPIASITSRTVVPGSRQSHFETNPKPVTKSRPPLERVGTSLGSLTSDASASSGGSGGSGASSQSGTSSNTASNDGGSADGSALASSAGSGSGSGSGSDSDPRPAKAARHGNGNGNGRGVGGIGVKERRVQLGRVEDGTWRGQDELQLERQRERGVVGLSVLADAATQVECGKGTGRGNRR